MNLKNTTKLAITSIAFAGLLFAGKTNAQTTKNPGDSEGLRFGIGVEPGIPTGDIRNFSHFAIGGSARLQYDLRGPVSLMLTSGFTDFIARDVTVGATTVKPDNYGIVPVKVGAKIFPAHNFYFSAEAGPGFETNGVNKSTKLILSPGIGVAESHSGLDLGLRYENYSGGNSGNFGLVALRIAYGFRL